MMLNDGAEVELAIDTLYPLQVAKTTCTREVIRWVVMGSLLVVEEFVVGGVVGDGFFVGAGVPGCGVFFFVVFIVIVIEGLGMLVIYMVFTLRGTLTVAVRFPGIRVASLTPHAGVFCLEGVAKVTSTFQ